VYEWGEGADWTGLVVTGTYSDGSTRVETDYTISGFDSSSPGEKTITVSKSAYNYTADYFTVTVRTLNSLSVSTAPTKQVYEWGEGADWTGLEVTGTYSDGSTRVETDYTISGFDSSSPGEKTITVSKSAYNYTADYFTVTVEGLTSLSISVQPSKLVYEVGESPDWTGLVVIGYYFIKNPQIETINYNSEISGFDSSSPGIKTITVTKNGVSSPSFTVEVLPRGSGGITILPVPSQTGDITLTQAGTTVTASDGYANYQWFVDDMARPANSGSNGKAITLSVPPYSAGKHRVRVTAWKQGLPYSGEITITLP
jgi:hypothetical protein